MPEVTVATLNLFNRMGEWESRAPLVIDQLQVLSPDVMGLQEIDLMLDQGMWVSRQINLRLGSARPHYRIKQAANPGTRASYHGIGTLARIEFLEHDVIDLMTFERVAQRMLFRAGNQLFLFVNTHLHHPPEAERERAEQIDYLLQWLDRDMRGLPVVIVGDFNAYTGEQAVSTMKGRYRSAFEAVHGHEPEKTWPTPVNTFDNSPPGTLDYVFVSEQFRIKSAGLAFDRPDANDSNLYPSDHLGVYATLEL